MVIKQGENARTCDASATCKMEESTAEMRVGTRQATTSRSRVNARIGRVSLRYGSFRHPGWRTSAVGGRRYMDLKLFASQHDLAATGELL